MAHVLTRKQMRNENNKRKQNTSAGLSNGSASNSFDKKREDGEGDDSQPLLSQEQEDFDNEAEDALIETVMDNLPK